MTPLPFKTLAVIGAGPKGLAVAVKAKVLAEFGLPVARVTLIEKNRIAANWSGEFGYTNGELLLGTSPEKDVVFPMEVPLDDARLKDAIQKRLLDFTWAAYLTEQGQYSDWIDRGRPAPCHIRWSKYLQWVFTQIKDDIELIHGEVLEIDQAASQWNIELRTSNQQTHTLSFDQVMVTGPGHIAAPYVDQQSQIAPPVYDLQDFWRAIKAGEFSSQGSIAIIGAGENAASIMLQIGQSAPDAAVDIVSPKGFISTRAENFYENQFYSQPDRNGWKNLSHRDRQDFMSRTDLGVISVHAMTLLNDQRRHTITPGRVINLKKEQNGVTLQIEYNGAITEKFYGRVIIASGFDQAKALRSLLTGKTIASIERVIKKPFTQENLALHIGDDLALEGLACSLFLPMLAGLRQGPGFANLSCLGKLSDRVLLQGHRYATVSPRPINLQLLEAQ